MEALPSIDNLAGPFLVQPLIACTLFGITLVQSRTYFEHCANDPRLVIAAIAILYVLHIFYVATLANVSYTFMVTRFADYAGLSRPPALFCIGAAVTGIFTIVAQLYYARQVYILGQRKWLIPSLIVGLATLSFTFTIASTVKGYSYGNFQKFDQFEYGVLIWLSGAAAADVLISISLVYHLRRHRKDTAFAETRSLLSRVISNTIENNALTCIVACVDAIMFSQYKNWGGSWHIVLNGALVGLYFTSLLTSLNARHRFATERTLVRHFGTNMLHSGTLSGRVPDMTSGPEGTTRDAQYQRSGTSRTGRERSSTSTSSGATVSLFRALTGPRRPSAAVIMEEGRPVPCGPTLIVTQASIVEQIRLEKSEEGSRQEQLERRGSLSDSDGSKHEAVARV